MCFLICICVVFWTAWGWGAVLQTQMSAYCQAVFSFYPPVVTEILLPFFRIPVTLYNMVLYLIKIFIKQKDVNRLEYASVSYPPCLGLLLCQNLKCFGSFIKSRMG